jgi:hypothetical protein
MRVSIQRIAGDGSPDRNSIASAAVDLGSDPASVVFEPALDLEGGTPVAVVLTSSGDNCVPGSNTGNVYGGGRFVYTTEPPELEWVPFDDWDMALELLYLM